MTFARHLDGVAIWKDGKLVGVVPVDQLPSLIIEACARLKAR